LIIVNKVNKISSNRVVVSICFINCKYSASISFRHEEGGLAGNQEKGSCPKKC
jgi:hypothetical protein